MFVFGNMPPCERCDARKVYPQTFGEPASYECQYADPAHYCPHVDAWAELDELETQLAGLVKRIANSRRRKVMATAIADGLDEAYEGFDYAAFLRCCYGKPEGVPA